MAENSAGQEWCAQHRGPAAECRHPYSVRLQGDTRQAAGAAADGMRMTFNAFVSDATDAMAGLVRCWRCRNLIPLEFGNLQGMTLRDAVAAARTAAFSQKCSDHEPVLIGAAPAGVALARPAMDGSPVPVVFQPPPAPLGAS